MEDPMVDTTVVENLLSEAIMGGITGIEFYGPDEEPPSTDEDQSGDDPPDRWCRLGNVIFTPSGARRSSSGDTAIGTATITITVGCAMSATDPDQGGTPARLNKDVFDVAATIDNQMLDHDATTHRLKVGEAARRVEPTGFHQRMKIGIITASATVYRKSGRTAVLNS